MKVYVVIHFCDGHTNIEGIFKTLKSAEIYQEKLLKQIEKSVTKIYYPSEVFIQIHDMK